MTSPETLLPEIEIDSDVANETAPNVERSEEDRRIDAYFDMAHNPKASPAERFEAALNILGPEYVVSEFGLDSPEEQQAIIRKTLIKLLKGEDVPQGAKIYNEYAHLTLGIQEGIHEDSEI